MLFRIMLEPLRNVRTVPIWFLTATLMLLNKLRRRDDHGMVGSAGCTRACCSWSLAFLRPVLTGFAPRSVAVPDASALAWQEAADIRLPMNEAIRPGPENPQQAMGLPVLSVVVPTFNERDNVEILIEQLDRVLRGIDWEVVFVDDDSPDGTARRVLALAQRDRRTRCCRACATR